MRFKYKYIIYKVYSWTANKKNDTPIANTILALGVAHFFQLLTVLLFIDRIITPLKWVWGINKTYLFIAAIFYFISFYLVIYNKKRWDTYIKEYSNEPLKDRKRGNIMVIVYLIGSILMFFISLPVLFALSKH
jgi:glucan phosphoethanolaminetransferase (alkaline phosphatase superfamily)